MTDTELEFEGAMREINLKLAENERRRKAAVRELALAEKSMELARRKPPARKHEVLRETNPELVAPLNGRSCNPFTPW
jgi:hypothetical protein